MMNHITRSNCIWFKNDCSISLVVLFLIIHHTRGNVVTKKTRPSDEESYVFRNDLNLVPVEWNSLQEPWLNFQVRLCGHLCNDTRYLKVNMPDPIECSPSCFGCDCNFTCPIYGTCCPTLDESTPLRQEDVLLQANTDTWYFKGNLSHYKFIDKNDFADGPDLRLGKEFRNLFRCSQMIWPFEVKRGYYILDSCPSGTSNSLRDLCESSLAIDRLDYESFTPVTDPQNGLTFRNVHCARCNKLAYDFKKNHESYPEVKINTINNTAIMWLETLRKWKIKVQCLSYQQFYKIKSESEFLRAVIQNSQDISKPMAKRCIVRLEPPSAMGMPRSCLRLQGKMIAQRNDSESCFEPSDHIKKTLRDLCHSLNTRTYGFASKSSVFCYMCNDDFPFCDLIQGPDDKWLDTVIIESPLAFMLGYKAGAQLDTSNIHACASSERYLCDEPSHWMDEQNSCQLPLCADGKILDTSQNVVCKTAVPGVNNLQYKVSMILIPNQRVSAKNTTNVHEQLQQYLNFSAGTNLHIRYVLYGDLMASNEEDYHIQFVHIDGTIYGDESLRRDVFENSVIDSKSAQNKDKSWLKLVNESRILYGMELIKAVIKALYGDTQIPDLIARDSALSRDIYPPSPSSSEIFLGPVYKKMISYQLQNGKRLINNRYGHIDRRKNDMIDLNPILICPFVELNFSNVRIQSNDEIGFAFHYRSHEYVFNISGYENKLSLENGKLRICFDAFRSEFQKVTNDSFQSRILTESSITTVTKIKGYIHMVCLGISVGSLLLTIISYAVFQVLRNLAGLNTMTLSICLALAQIYFIVLISVVGRYKGWICQLCGMAFHYSWLVAFHWMSVCCIHMFRIFNRIQMQQMGSNSYTPFLKYSAYAFGSPALCVLLNILLYQIFSGGSSFGYHPRLCLYDIPSSYVPPIFTFQIPLGLVVLSNGVLFSLTIRKIKVTRDLQNTVLFKKNQGDLFKYVKLSTITGLFWFLSFLSSWSDNEIIDFICIPLVTLQGVFIFVSFTCNAKVKNLWMVRLGFDKKTSRGRGKGMATTSTDTTSFR